MTTIYLIRHSKPLKVNNDLNSDNIQIQNEKSSLSIEGEKIAKEKLSIDEFNNIDTIYSSNYVRAIQTAKYLSEAKNIEIKIFSKLGERKFGINSWDELPEKFERKQFLDETYKIGDGENQIEVRERMYSAITDILEHNKNKQVAVVSHATAISYLLRKWCDISIVNDKLRYSFNGKILLEGYLDYCEIFKLTFDDNNNLIDIKNIK